MPFFELLSRRHEHAATVLTSNKGVEDWGEIFGDDVMAAAIDREPQVPAVASAVMSPAAARTKASYTSALH